MVRSNKHRKNIRNAFSASKRWNSIKYATEGLVLMIKNEPNAIIHSLAMIIVMISACIKHLSKIEWSLLIIAISIVWIAETINTAIEKLCDLYSQSINPFIKTVKDISAASVLLAAVTSLTIGFIIFFL
jgi:diacylglycerol kinase (ATP)